LTIDDCLVKRVGRTTWLSEGKASLDGEIQTEKLKEMRSQYTGRQTSRGASLSE
jgi:hypothetical protein